MAQDYSEIGLDDGLLKMADDSIPQIDPDLQIEDGSIQGLKLQTKSVSLDKLYGQDLTVGGGNNISGKIIAIDESGQARITIDATTGLNVNADYTGSIIPVLQATIFGTNAGDVQVGNYGGSAGALWDNSTGTFNVKGAISLGTGSVVSGDYITTGTLNAALCNVTNINAANITVGKIQASQLNVSTLSAITANAGTLTAGVINGLTIVINHQGAGGSDPGNNAYLRWDLGSHMWEDGSRNLGINSIGTDGMYFYVNNTQDLVLTTSTINAYKSFRPLGGIDFTGSIPGDGTISEGDINNIDLLRGHNDLRFQASGDDFKFLNDGGSGNVFRIEHISGELHSLSSSADFAGSTLKMDSGLEIEGHGHKLTLNTDVIAKNAIVKTSKGYRALYCMESPEVWFMDFCKGERKFIHKGWKFWKWGFDWIAYPDSMFLEVTTQPYVIMPTLMKGIVQIWGHRKGLEDKRFEEKTEAEFKKNNKFWNQAKVDRKVDKD